jgi:hypothetical protein
MTTTVAELLTKTNEELDSLFAQAQRGSIPDGESKGTAIIAAGTSYSDEVAKMVELFAWQGKVFDAEHGFLRNYILPFGLKAIVAKVYYGESWMDQKDCIVIDYSETSLVASRVRDEIRLIQTGLFLGKVYWGRKALIHFTLEV